MLPYLKICGITRYQDACLCADAGAGALGVVFYSRSPRNVTPEQARDLFLGIPTEIARVGVFVNHPVSDIITIARTVMLDTVQLHGDEPTDDILELQQAGYPVVKVLKAGGPRLLTAAQALPPHTRILVECGQGILPGGNAAVWDWGSAAILADTHSFAIAGGLDSDNLAIAAHAARASGFDASSSLEAEPGIKNPTAVLSFVQAATRIPVPAHPFRWKRAP